MKKNEKGFALAEILAVTLVLMVIFTVLYSNFAPLKGEYEKATIYADVSNQYTIHNFRKLYMNNVTLSSGEKYKILNCSELTQTNNNICKSYMNQYNVTNSQILLTTYNLTEIKNLINDAESNNTINNLDPIIQTFMNYIKYLPKYNEERDNESYRLLIKTDTGYATTTLNSQIVLVDGGDNCFATTENEDGTLTISDYLCYEGNKIYNTVRDVVIPSTINGKTVTIIGKAAFLGSFSNEELKLTSVVIPNTITTIKERAFETNSLRTVIIPSSVKIIEDTAFQKNLISNLSLPNTVLSIDTGTFSQNLLPPSQAFFYKRTDNNGDGIAEIDNSVLIGYGGAEKNVTVPSNVKEIGPNAFYASYLTSLTIPNTVTTLGRSALGFNNFTSLVIPNSITSIPSSAISFNDNLTSLTLPEGLKEIESFGISYNKNLTQITIPSTVTKIGGFAFSGNDLRTVTIPSNSQLVANKAYDGILYGAFNKGPYSNLNLTKIINKSGKAFAFESALFNTNSSSYIVTGTITNATYGDVVITSS